MAGYVYLITVILFQAVLQHIERRELYRLLSGEPVSQQHGKMLSPISRHEQVLRGWRSQNQMPKGGLQKMDHTETTK